MNLSDAAHMARTLMNQHGFGHVPFEFDGGKRRLGQCVFSRETGAVKKISLSRHYTALLPEDEIRDVILHEIAHAMSGHNEGHGMVWKRNAMRVGAKPNRCATPSASPDTHPWTGRCPNGHDTGKFFRAPRRVRSCSQCSPKFDKRYIIQFHFNGKPADLSQMPESFRSEYRKVVGW